ncbi:hypothetical protein [Lysobacter gummosus]|uniref:hypothetical protein n=1 Tax=Lysobacter gummosus TaxID=262324 RepID=UPI0036402A61
MSAGSSPVLPDKCHFGHVLSPANRISNRLCGACGSAARRAAGPLPSTEEGATSLRPAISNRPDSN